MNIRFRYDNIKFRVRRSGEIKKFLIKVITDEKKVPGDLNFILTGDSTILDLNRQFLKHNYYTDVIAFDYNENDTVNGEIYISIDTIRRNAVKYHATVKEEFMRVLIHGTLHLCGYEDKEEKMRGEMFRKQEHLLEKYIKER